MSAQLILITTYVFVYIASGTCEHALINDLDPTAFSATSFYDDGSKPSYAIYYPGDGWAAGTNVTTPDSPTVGSLTVDLGSIKTVCSVGTRATLYNESTTLYKLAYSLDDVLYVVYDQALSGPSAWSQSEVRHALNADGVVVKARYLKFTPIEWSWWPAMCVEAYEYSDDDDVPLTSTTRNVDWLGISAISAVVFVVVVMILACAYVRVKTDAANKYVNMKMSMDLINETEAEDKAFVDMKK